METVRTILIGAIALGLVAVAGVLTLLSYRLQVQTEVQQESLDVIQTILQEQEDHRRDLVVLSALDRFAACDIATVNARNSQNSSNDDFYKERFFCSDLGLLPLVDEWGLETDLGRFGIGLPEPDDE